MNTKVIDQLTLSDIKDIICDKDYTASDLDLDIEDEDEIIYEYFDNKDLYDIISDRFDDTDVYHYIEKRLSKDKKIDITNFISENVIVNQLRLLGYEIKKENN